MKDRCVRMCECACVCVCVCEREGPLPRHPMFWIINRNVVQLTVEQKTNVSVVYTHSSNLVPIAHIRKSMHPNSASVQLHYSLPLYSLCYEI